MLNTDTKAENNGDLPIWAEYSSHVVVLYSLVCFTLGTDPSFKNTSFIQASYIFTLSIFTIEYIWRILSSTRKMNYIISFYGIIDLIAILPALVSLGVLDFRASRILRLLRLFRLAKFLRFDGATKTLLVAFISIKKELIIFSFLTLTILYLAAVGIWYFESSSQPEHFGSVAKSLWWAVVTLTTVGYGDAYPITPGGKVFTTVILFIGLGLVAVPSGLLASSLVETKKQL